MDLFKRKGKKVEKMEACTFFGRTFRKTPYDKFSGTSSRQDLIFLS